MQLRFSYERSLLNRGVKRTNIIYGGSIPDVQNVIFVNGGVDPWHALSILHDLSESSPAIFIPGSFAEFNFMLNHAVKSITNHIININIRLLSLSRSSAWTVWWCSWANRSQTTDKRHCLFVDTVLKSCDLYSCTNESRIWDIFVCI